MSFIIRMTFFYVIFPRGKRWETLVADLASILHDRAPVNVQIVQFRFYRSQRFLIRTIVAFNTVSIANNSITVIRILFLQTISKLNVNLVRFIDEDLLRRLRLPLGRFRLQLQPLAKDHVVEEARLAERNAVVQIRQALPAQVGGLVDRFLNLERILKV